MKSSARNIQMTSYDDLFSVGDVAGTTGEKVQEIALGELFPFKGHPFKVLDDEAMEEMVESIRLHGVLVPGIARPRAEGGYELLAGHRRRHALELAGETMMPVIIRELDGDESTLFMVDSNLQRENLLPGENYSVDILSENSNDSARNIHRFIRLTELLGDLLQMVDDRKIPFNTAVELSYLASEEQRELLSFMGELSVVPSLEQARRLKKYSQEGKLNRDVMDAILTEERAAPVQVTLKKEKLKQYFPRSYTQAQMEEVIFSLLEMWKKDNKDVTE